MVTKAQAVEMLKASGKDQMAEMVMGMDVVPGVGIDFSAIGGILLILAALYVLSGFFGWLQHYTMAGVSQRSVYR